MKVYFFVFVLAFLAQFIHVRNSKQYWWRTVCSFIPLFLFLALREDYGVDEAGYHAFFDGVHSASNIFIVNDHMEPGYAILNKIMPTFQSLIAICSFITCWAYSYLIYRFVPQNYSWLAVILIFMVPSQAVFFMISGLRNGLAASLLILGSYFLERRKLLFYAIMAGVAMSIHTSALVMFVLCYLIGHNSLLTKRGLIAWTVVLLFAATTSLSSLTDQVMPIIEFATGRYVEQLEELSAIADERGFLGSLVGLIFAAGIFYYQLAVAHKRTSKYPPQEIETLYKYKLGLIYAASFTLGILGGRSGQYMIYFFIVTVTCIFAYTKNQIFKYGYLLLVTYFFWTLFKMWMSNPLFKYSIYTSIIGDF